MQTSGVPDARGTAFAGTQQDRREEGIALGFCLDEPGFWLFTRRREDLRATGPPWDDLFGFRNPSFERLVNLSK